MKKRSLPWLALLTCPFLLFANPVKDAKDILAQSKVTGGLIVHLGCGNGDLLAELGKDERFLAHGLDRDDAKLKAATEVQAACQGRAQEACEKFEIALRTTVEDSAQRRLAMEEQALRRNYSAAEYNEVQDVRRDCAQEMAEIKAELAQTEHQASIDLSEHRNVLQFTFNYRMEEAERDMQQQARGLLQRLARACEINFSQRSRGNWM